MYADRRIKALEKRMRELRGEPLRIQVSFEGGESVMSVSDMIGTGAEFKNVLSGQRLPELDMCLDYVLPAMRDLC